MRGSNHADQAGLAHPLVLLSSFLHAALVREEFTRSTQRRCLALLLRHVRPDIPSFGVFDHRPEVLAVVAPSVDPAHAAPRLLLSEPGPCLVGDAVRLRSTPLYFAVNSAVHSGAAAFRTIDCMTLPGTDWPPPPNFHPTKRVGSHACNMPSVGATTAKREAEVPSLVDGVGGYACI